MNSQQTKTAISYLIDFLAVLSVVIGLVYFFKIKDLFLAVSFTFVAPIAVLLPRYIYKRKLRQKYNLSLLKTLESFAAVMFVLASAGTFGLYNAGIEYDSLIHVIITVLIAILVAFVWTFRKTSGFEDGYLSLCISVFSFTIILGAFWEVFQMSGDKVFGSKMFFDLFQPINLDVACDLAADTIGAFIGSVLVYFKWSDWHKGWLIK